jgi:hypothetical protein
MIDFFFCFSLGIFFGSDVTIYDHDHDHVSPSRLLFCVSPANPILSLSISPISYVL